MEEIEDAKPLKKVVIPKASMMDKLFGPKVRVVGNYVLDGFAPLVATIALIVAVMAVNDNKVSQVELEHKTEVIKNLNDSLQAAKAELNKLNAAMADIAQLNQLRAEEQKIQHEQAVLVVESVSKVQSKLKISPTLEEQMKQALAHSAVVPAGTMAAPPVVITSHPADTKNPNSSNVSKVVPPVTDAKHKTENQHKK